jgi:hypothetical protein
MAETPAEAWKLGLTKGQTASKPSDTLAKIVAQMKGRPEPPKPPPAPERLSVPQLPPIIEPSVRDKIAGNEFLRSQGKFEVETSFGTYAPDGKKFFPGVSATQFGSLMKVLRGMHDKGVLTLDSYVDKVEIMEKERIRRITDEETGSVVWEKKDRYTRHAIENTSWGYRIYKSIETFEQDIPENFVPDTIRYRNRHSFVVSDTRSDIYGFQFDLTKVKEERIQKKETRSAKGHKEGEEVQEKFVVTKYEVEIERNKGVVSRSPDSITIEALEAAIKFTLVALQSSTEQHLLTLQERQAAVKKHNDLFSRNIKELEAKGKKKIFLAPYRLWKDYWNKPTNIRIDDLLNKFVNNYAVTLKLDGVRKFVLLTSSSTYAAGPPDDLWKVGSPSIDYQNTLLDTEMYESDGEVTYYVFDILFYKGRDIRGDRFPQRLERVKEVVEYMSENEILFDAQVRSKEFFTTGTFYDRSAEAFEMADKSELRLDGLIFQPSTYYNNKYTRKWKPADQMTIDFKLRKVGKDDFELLVGGHHSEEIVFKGTSRYPYSKLLHVEKGMYEGVNVDGVIAELKWTAGEFELYRIREDRDKPNALKTAQDVWDDIHRPISAQTIMGNTVQVMRRDHNNTKRDMLKTYFKEGDVLMDWGSGRGGDLEKWQDVGLSKVYVVEPNETNLEELERRLEEMTTKGYDASRVVVVRDSEGGLVGGQSTQVLLDVVGEDKLDGITAFFSLTYFGKDPEIYNGMIESIDSLLSQGGKFVGIVMDGVKVRKALEESKKEQGFEEEEAASLMNPSFSIEQVSAYSDAVEEGKNEIEITLNDPTSMVKNQQEWLFYFDIFERELGQRGFELVTTGFLDESQNYDVLPKDSKIFSGMNRYFVFQKRGEEKGKKKAKVSKTPKVDIPKYVEAGVDEMIPLHTIYGGMYQIGTIRDQSSFIHATIRAFYTKYFGMTESERIEYIEKVRQMMSRTATQEIYDELDNGELAESYTSKVMGEMEKPSRVKAAQIGFSEYRLDVYDPDTFIGPQKGQELLSTLLGINILVLGPTSKPLAPLYGRDVVTAREVSAMYSKTVVLTTSNNIHYSLVAKKTDDVVYTVFGVEEPFIQDVLNEAFPLMSEEELEEA